MAIENIISSVSAEMRVVYSHGNFEYIASGCLQNSVVLNLVFLMTLLSVHSFDLHVDRSSAH